MTHSARLNRRRPSLKPRVESHQQLRAAHALPNIIGVLFKPCALRVVAPLPPPARPHACVSALQCSDGAVADCKASVAVVSLASWVCRPEHHGEHLEASKGHIARSPDAGAPSVDFRPVHAPGAESNRFASPGKTTHRAEGGDSGRVASRCAGSTSVLLSAGARQPQR